MKVATDVQTANIHSRAILLMSTAVNAELAHSRINLERHRQDGKGNPATGDAACDAYDVVTRCAHGQRPNFEHNPPHQANHG